MALTKQQKPPLWVYLLFDVIEELHASKANALERLAYGTSLDLDDPSFREESARFWRDLRRKLEIGRAHV